MVANLINSLLLLQCHLQRLACMWPVFKHPGEHNVMHTLAGIVYFYSAYWNTTLLSEAISVVVYFCQQDLGVTNSGLRTLE